MINKIIKMYEEMTDNILKIFGLNLKLERVRLGLTQEQVAEKLDFSSVYISNVESGKHNQVSLINAYNRQSQNDCGQIYPTSTL